MKTFTKEKETRCSLQVPGNDTKRSYSLIKGKFNAG